MSIRKTIDMIELPDRDRYGQQIGTGWSEAHVATTIVHDVVHLSISIDADPERNAVLAEAEVNMTNDEARALIVELTAAIEDNERNTRT